LLVNGKVPEGEDGNVLSNIAVHSTHWLLKKKSRSFASSMATAHCKQYVILYVSCGYITDSYGAAVVWVLYHVLFVTLRDVVM
jgi:hypothetical protein